MQAWNDFLSTQSFSDAPIGDCAITDLSHLGIIRVSGEDRENFLQGQLTNDVRKLDATHSQLSAWCSPKGRMLSSFRLVPDGDDLLMLLPAERLQATLQRLRLFVLRAKVTLEDASEQLARIELSGTCASDLLPITPPAADNQVSREDGYILAHIPGDRPRFLVLGEPDLIQSLWQEAAPAAQPTARSAWALLDIRAGLPTVYQATSDAFVPQMVNLQLLDGVSFTKGCYTGQEVVARMQYLGKLKRRMYRVHIASDTAPVAGDALYSPSSESSQGAGRVVEAAPAPQGGYEALVVAPVACAEAADLRLHEADGPVLEMLDNPYPFPE